MIGIGSALVVLLVIEVAALAADGEMGRPSRRPSADLLLCRWPSTLPT